MNESEYFEQNKVLWDTRTPVHIESEFYNVADFLSGNSSLTCVEDEFLMSVENKKVLHLQCHFGLDTLSLMRLGGECVGIDFSELSIEKARELNTQIGGNAIFYHANVYDTLDLNLGKFDIVYTTYGAIGWLPDLDRWAQVIAGSLKPGGQLYFAEFHPVLLMFDTASNAIKYSYLEKAEPDEDIEENTYADANEIISVKSYWWAHSLSEIMNALTNAGIKISLFKELDYSPYNCYPNMRDLGNGKYRFGDDAFGIPQMYVIIGEKG
jgi:SAM-dependent methyltransferase